MAGNICFVSFFGCMLYFMIQRLNIDTIKMWTSFAEVTNNPKISVVYSSRHLFLTHITSWWLCINFNLGPAFFWDKPFLWQREKSKRENNDVLSSKNQMCNMISFCKNIGDHLPSTPQWHEILTPSLGRTHCRSTRKD